MMSSQKAPEFFWDPNSDKRETLIFKGVSITLDPCDSVREI